MKRKCESSMLKKSSLYEERSLDVKDKIGSSMSKKSSLSDDMDMKLKDEEAMSEAVAGAE